MKLADKSLLVKKYTEILQKYLQDLIYETIQRSTSVVGSQVWHKITQTFSLNPHIGITGSIVDILEVLYKFISQLSADKYEEKR